MAGSVTVVLLPLLVVWSWSVHRPGERGLRRFSRRYGVVLDDTTRPFLRDRIRRGRCWRAAGGTVGWTLALLPAFFESARPAMGTLRPALSSAPLAGYLLGAVLVELVAAALRTEQPRRALLRFRQVSDYVPSWPLLVLWVGSIACLALTPALWRLGGITADPAYVPRGAVATRAAFVLVNLVLTLMALRAVAHRRQLVTVPATLVLDEALRADSSRRVAGIGMVIAATAAASALGEALGPLSLWAGAGVSALAYAFFGLWWALLDSPWRMPDEAAV